MTDLTRLTRGNLILIGGAEDKKDAKIVLKKVVEVSKAERVVVIPTASTYPREVFNNYDDAFKQLGIKEVFCFDIRYKEEADRAEYFEMLEKSELVFFSGGDQVKLVETLDGTQIFNKIYERFFAGTLTIAGTSAGAASASNPMLYDGDYKGFVKGSVNSGKGFGFVNDITFDTHFLHRERVPRLLQYLISGHSDKGIGLDEDTGVVIAPNLTFEVIGSGMVTIINKKENTQTNYNQLSNLETFSASNVNIGFLSPGTCFDMNKWEIIDHKKKENIQYEERKTVEDKEQKNTKKKNIADLIRDAFLN